MADQNMDAAARAAIRAQTLTAIGLNIPVFSGIKPYSITPEQLKNNTGGWTNDQTIEFVITAVQDSALKWYDHYLQEIWTIKAGKLTKPN